MTHTSPVLAAIEYVRLSIDSGQLRPGDRLPPEGKLAQSLKISRASLRRGFDSLSALGVLERAQGNGTFLSNKPLALELLTPTGSSDDEDMILETRLALEPGTAALAALRARGEHLAELLGELNAMHRAEDLPCEYEVHLTRFHHAIADAAENPVLRMFIASALAADGARIRSLLSECVPQGWLEIHRKIYLAILHRKPQKALLAMRTYLNLPR